MRLRHWVLFVGLCVAVAQFYFISMVLDFYSAPRLVVFAAAATSPGATRPRPAP
jgi:hypothetical protein